MRVGGLIVWRRVARRRGPFTVRTTPSARQQPSRLRKATEKLEAVYPCQYGHLDRRSRAGTLHGSQQIRWILDSMRTTVLELSAATESFPPGARERLAACIARAVETGTPRTIELPLTTARGNSRSVRMLGAPGGAGQSRGLIVGAIQHVSQAVEGKEDMIAAAQRLALAVESAHIGLWDSNVTEDRFSTSPK
jgi:hypothetical protein